AGPCLRAPVRGSRAAPGAAAGEPGAHRTDAGGVMGLARRSRERGSPWICLALPLAGLLALAPACTHSPQDDAIGPLHDAGQLVLVTTAGWDADRGTLRRFERVDGGWQPVGGAA